MNTTQIFTHQKPDAHRTSKKQRCLQSLDKLLSKHNGFDYRGYKVVGDETRARRRKVLRKAVSDLNDLGYKLAHVNGIKGRHITALVQDWEKRGLMSRTIQSNFSALKLLTEWIGKHGMVGPVTDYLKDPSNAKVRYVADKAKDWRSMGIDPKVKFRELKAKDPLVAIVFEVMAAYGLRLREASLLRPHLADETTVLNVTWGTKGGRPRHLPIKGAVQRDVIDRMKLLVRDKNQTIIPSTLKYNQWKRHVYHVCEQCKITRIDGITPHGLRHERLNDLYEQITGCASPVRGGDTSTVPEDLDHMARLAISETAGHSRESISAMYIGSRSNIHGRDLAMC